MKCNRGIMSSDPHHARDAEASLSRKRFLRCGLLAAAIAFGGTGELKSQVLSFKF